MTTIYAEVKEALVAMNLAKEQPGYRQGSIVDYIDQAEEHLRTALKMFGDFDALFEARSGDPQEPAAKPSKEELLLGAGMGMTVEQASWAVNYDILSTGEIPAYVIVCSYHLCKILFMSPDGKRRDWLGHMREIWQASGESEKCVVDGLIAASAARKLGITLGSPRSVLTFIKNERQLRLSAQAEPTYKPIIME